MNPIRERLVIYALIAVLTTLTNDLADVRALADLSPIQILRLSMNATVAGLLVWRAFIDQSVTKYAEPKTEPEPKANP
jgi:hypothetical protein